tara:strand:+ start:1040 stop:1270 length:231 start_codon:yes stop_codon:yes gene_type:complete
MQNTAKRTVFTIDFISSEGGIDTFGFVQQHDGTVTIMSPYTDPDAWEDLSKEEARTEWRRLLALTTTRRGKDMHVA